MYYNDLSPNKVFMNTSTMVAKICGFGNLPDNINDEYRPGSVAFLPPEVLQENAVYSQLSDVFGYGGIVLFTVVGEWPIPTSLVKDHLETRKIIALSEVERRQQYLDKMIGEAEVLRPLVESCLNNNPAKRPTMEVVSEKVKEIKIDYTDCHPEIKVREFNIKYLTCTFESTCT